MEQPAFAAMRPTKVERARHLWRNCESWQFWIDVEAEGITPAEAYAGIDLAVADRERELIDARVHGSPEYGSIPEAKIKVAPGRADAPAAPVKKLSSTA